MNGVVATPHAEATSAALQAYARGGNAVDAALAAAVVLTVVCPQETSIGGDLWALVAQPGESVRAVNGSGASAAAVDVAALRRQHVEIPEAGPVPVTVPGVLAGWETLAGMGSQLGLSGAFGRAIALAADGMPISPSLAACTRRRLSYVVADAGLRALLTRDGEPLPEGTTVCQPALARSLEQIAAAGPRAAFYEGPVGAAWVDGLRALGSPLTTDDLADHRTVVTGPIEIELDGLRLATAPPNSQGFVLLEMLAALGTLDPDPAAAVAATLLAVEDRESWLGDPVRSPVPLERLLDPAIASARLVERRALATATAPPARGDTVAVVALDAEGRAVSLIQSVFQTFGASILEPATGIVCHNRGRGFTLRPGAPNELAPGTRPAHSLVPLLALDGSDVVASIGTMGGRAQPQILLQVVGGALARDRALDETVAAARWVVGAKDIGFDEPTVALEAHAGGELEAALADQGLPVAWIDRFDDRAGHAQIARIGASGLESASDPRSDGVAGSA